MTTNAALTHRPGNWIVGTVNGYKVEAKVYEEGSQYGMEQADRVSKLWISNGSRCVYFYDRCHVDVFEIGAADLVAVLEAVTAA